MDIWKYFDITHCEHVICNPTSDEKLARLVELLRLRRGAPVVDIAFGKGEFLFRLAETYDARCTGVDISSQFVAEARERLAARGGDLQVELLEMNGADYRPPTPGSMSLAACVGASWIFGGHAGTLDALIAMTEPGGWVVVGEPYWLREPDDEYLSDLEMARDDFGTHASNAAAGEERGLDLVYTLVSSGDDWDRYEGLQWYAAHAYARANPDDPDVPALLERVAKERAAYLRWGRESLGWSIYMFRRRG